MSRRDRAPREAIVLEVDEELRSHIEMRARDNERRGMGSAEARRDAERRFGDYERIARASLYQRLAPRDPNGDGPWRRLTTFADGVRQDVVNTLRAFARSPGLFAAAVVTLAVGFGATTAIFAYANHVLLRPVPGISRPDELATIWVGRPSEGGGFRPSSNLSYLDYRDVAARLTQLSGITGYQFMGVAVALPGGGGARRLDGQVVTESYFEVLGVAPRAGALFTSAADPAAEQGRVVISDRLWLSMFHRSRDAIGATLLVNGYPFSIMGVAAEGFRGPELGADIDVWLRGESYALLRHFDDPDLFDGREYGWFYTLIGRLAPGSTRESVRAELDALGAWLAQEYSETNESFGEIGFHVFDGFGTSPLSRGSMVSRLALLMGIGGLVLLIACANVANLLLVRGMGRRGETALRKALGARRGRLLRQHLTEGIVLWLVGGISGVGVGLVMARLFDAGGIGAVAAGVRFDGRVIAFASLTSLLVGIVFATVPAFSASRVAPGASLQEVAPTGSRRRLGVASLLTVVQLSASLVLLVGTLLLVRTLVNVTRVDSGIDVDGVYAIVTSPDDLGYSQQEAFQYHVELDRRLRLRPEVAAASVVSRVPFQCCGYFEQVRVPGGADGEETEHRAHGIVIETPGFFELMGIPLLYGRTFSRDDIASPGSRSALVAVVGETFARELFGEVNVVGRRIAAGRAGDGDTREIIGVVGDVRYNRISDPPDGVIYQPAGLAAIPFRGRYTLVRLRADADIAATARDIAREIDPSLPIQRVLSMNEVLEEARAMWALLAKLMSILASLAAVLAAVGLYGVVAFGVTARAREFGIRLALGAEPRQILRIVLRGVAILTGIGLAIGFAASMGLVRLLESYLYGIAPFDPVTWAAAATGLVVVALLAAWLPARGATRVDPVEALRSH